MRRGKTEQCENISFLAEIESASPRGRQKFTFVPERSSYDPSQARIYADGWPMLAIMP
jgi:hypothetical protein